MQHPAYPAEVASAKQAGIPTTLADLYTPAPTTDNAAPYILEIGRRLKERPLTDKERASLFLSLGRPITQTEWRSAEALLKNRHDILALTDRALTQSRCVFPDQSKVADPAAILMPELSVSRSAVRFITLQSLVMAKEGRFLQAVQSEDRGFRMADDIGSDPLLMGLLTAEACDTIILRGMQKILAMSQGDPVVAAAVARSIDTHWHERSVAYALKTEFAFDNANIEYLRKQGPGVLAAWAGINNAAASVPAMSPRVWNAYMDISGTYTLKLMRRAIDVADQPYPQSSAALSVLDADVEDTKKPPAASFKVIAEVLFPMTAGLSDHRAGIRACADITRSASAVFLWKSRHGTYSESLAQAIAPVPADPFDLKPLRYRREGTGFVIYSVGKTGKYDGARLPKKHAVEWAFRYPS